MSSPFQKSNPRRQKLVPEVDVLPVAQDKFLLVKQDELLLEKHPKSTITTLESLREHLQLAIELEHATIPPYLCALYSIKEGTNLVPSAIIRSVVMEEMLHMTLAANMLNAIGGSPNIRGELFIPDYPTYLPHSDKAFKVGLGKFSREAIETFLKIERPAATDQPPQAHHYHTIGQFYQAIRIGLKYVEANSGSTIFTGDPSWQITPEQYYGGGGRILAIRSLADALEAVDEIEGQGEGIDGTINDPDHKLFGDDIEYAHYFKFNEIYHERFYTEKDSPQSPPSGNKIEVDWSGVYNMQPNPKMRQYKKDSELWNKSYEFNKAYMALLDNLHRAFNGKPETIVESAILMYKLKYLAVELMKTPVEGGPYTAGPTFEYV